MKPKVFMWDDWEAMMDRGHWTNLARRSWGYNPTLSKDILGFLMTTESQDLS